MNLKQKYCALFTEGCVVFRRSQRLHAADFIAGRSDHLELLKKMGIRIVTVNDGRVQLLHTASEVQHTDVPNNVVSLLEQDLHYLYQTWGQSIPIPVTYQLYIPILPKKSQFQFQNTNSLSNYQFQIETVCEQDNHRHAQCLK